MLNFDKLYRLNKSNQELIQILSPEISSQNQELFYKKSGDQRKFNKELKNKEIESLNEKKFPELEEAIAKIHDEVKVVLNDFSDMKRTRLDLDIAKIFHKNLLIPRRAIIDYDFWRYLTLFHFIELVKWRWEKNPEKPTFWYRNASTICGRALGIYLNKHKYDKDKTIEYTSRNYRIDCYRYWWIGNKLFDSKRGYYYLERIADKYKTEEVSVQDFINHLEGNKLLSENDRVAKIMAQAILLSGKKFSEDEARKCFNRYNAYSNRLFMEADENQIKSEICLLEV